MDSSKKIIAVFTPCYNEEKNVEAIYNRVKAVFAKLPQYEFNYYFIDNASTDKTVSVLRDLALRDERVKVIVNVRNFGHIRSSYYGFLQCKGEATIVMVADLQDPPEMIPQFLEAWEKGHPMVLGIKNKSKENPLMFFLRKVFYTLIKKISESDQLKNYTGFGLYDKKFLEIIKQIDDPYPYFRGMVSEYGWNVKTINYTQDKRASGKSKNNFFTLYDLAMLGFVNHSKVPLRLSAFIGFFTAMCSFLIAIFYFVYKLINWDSFQVGSAPMIIGIFFFSSIQLFFIGIIGEYIGSIHTQVRKRPMVIEKERINC